MTDPAKVPAFVETMSAAGVRTLRELAALDRRVLAAKAAVNMGSPAVRDLIAALVARRVAVNPTLGPVSRDPQHRPSGRWVNPENWARSKSEKSRISLCSTPIRWPTSPTCAASTA